MPPAPSTHQARVPLTRLARALTSAALFALSHCVYAQVAPAPPSEEPFDFNEEDLQSSTAVYMNADEVEGNIASDVQASGDVQFARGTFRVRTESIRYNVIENAVTSTERVRFQRDGDQVEGDGFRYDLDTDQGELKNITYRLSKVAQRRFAARGDAREAVFLSSTRSEFLDSRYTTCPPGQDDWFLRVGQLSVDRATDIGVARNASVVFKGVPFLYAPWLDFPIAGQRKSGFLTPTFGSSDASGFELSVPYYWNWRPNRDATIMPRILSKRGLQMIGELRYLEPKFSGQLDAEVLPGDRQANQDRHYFSIRHAQTLPWGWYAGLAMQNASDDDYFRDLSTRVALTSQTTLPREGYVGYNGYGFSFVGRMLSYQTLQDPAPAALREPPYRLTPQLNLSWQRNQLGPFDVSVLSEYTNFEHPSFVEGKRLITYPSVTLPITRSFGYVTPKLGLHYTRYDLNGAGLTQNRITRSLPILSVDSGLIFDREMSFLRKRYQQTLEPRLFLVKIPFKDQSAIPNFSTSELDFNFSQMFTENRFVGGDRINDADQITAALTTRFTDERGIERLRAAIGQRYNFTDQRVVLSGIPQTSKTSDLLLAASGQLSDKWYLDSGMQFNTDSGRTQRASVTTRYAPAPGKVANLTYRFARDTGRSTTADGFEQVDFSAEWPLSRRWYGLFRINYSLRDAKLVEGLAGLEYNATCWALRLVAHRFITAEQTVSNALLLQLELSGLAQVGNNPIETLRRNIPGYVKTSDIVP